MSFLSSAALLLTASFSSLSPAQQKDIDCLAVLTVASTEANSDQKFGLPNMSARVGRLSAKIGDRYARDYGMSADDFSSIFTDRLIAVMMRNAGGAQRIAKIKPQVASCASMLPQ